MAKRKQKEPQYTADGRKKSAIGAKRWRIKMRKERERLAEKEKKRQDFERRKKEKESMKSVEVKKEMVEGGGPIRNSLFERVTFPKRKEEKEKVSENLSKKRKNSEMTSEHKKEKKLKSSTQKQKGGKRAENGDQPKKKRDEGSGPNGASNTGGPTGNQSQNAPFQQAPAFNVGDGGGGYGGGGPQFGNGNPMNGLGNNEVPSLLFHGNRQFNEQSVSEVMQAMQVLANHNILRLGFGVGVAAMAQMRTGQESQMTANHGWAGFGDGYGGGGQGNQGGQQGDQSHWRQ